MLKFLKGRLCRLQRNLLGEDGDDESRETMSLYPERRIAPACHNGSEVAILGGELIDGLQVALWG